MTTTDPSPEREGLRAIWLEAHETIPPDGKDAAFAALGRIMKLASEALSTHPVRPTREEAANVAWNTRAHPRQTRDEVQKIIMAALIDESEQNAARSKIVIRTVDAILSLFRSLGGEA